MNGGIKLFEITFRNEQAQAALKNLQESGMDVIYGAGTVRTADQLSQALDAGAEFLVTPGLNENIVKLAQENNTPIYPGIDSTYGIEKAIELGLNTLKVFPAEPIGGIPFLKSLKAPYYDISFIPTGGVDISILEDYLALPNVAGIGGTFLAPEKLIQQQDYEKITEISLQLMEIVKVANKKREG